MQSYLQYRRIGLAVQKQVEQDQEKAAALTRAREEQNRSQSPVIDPETASKKEELSSPNDSTDDALSSEEPVRGNVLASIKTHLTTRTALGHALNGINVRDRTTHEGKGSQVFVVSWESDDDPLNPRNHSRGSRIATTLMVGLIAATVGAAAAIDSTILPQAAAEFGVSEVVESMATGLFLAAFACGSLFAGPLSETFGRNPIYISFMVVYMIFIMACGLAPNIGAQLVFRFLAGFFGATPFTCAGGSISDMWDPLAKTYAFPMFAIAGFAGTTFGPIIGSYIGVGNIGSWRWTEWIMLIISALTLFLITLFQPETYAPVLLKWKAMHLRRITGDDRFKAELEIMQTTLFTRLKVALQRPFLLTLEPIVLLMAVYLTILYIVLFTFLDGYTFIFDETYGIGQGLTNITFVAMCIGFFCLAIPVPWIYKRTKSEFEKSKAEGRSFSPEVRLWFAMFGAPMVPISLFWMGWTAYPSISIWSPILASALFGYGTLSVFTSAYLYIIDSYEVYAASALTFVTILRYLAAGGMTVAGIPFYRNLGVHWTLTIMACLTLILVPSPYVFYKYGYRVRKLSKYAVNKI